MWSILSGTIINALAVAAGSLLGLTVGGRVSDRYRTIILSALGLITLTLGMDAAVLHFSDTVKKFAPLVPNNGTYGARLAMVMISSLLLGTILGTALRLHERIEALGGWIHRRFSGGDGATFAEGFLTASVIFCIGPLTLLGCLRNGRDGNPDYLYIKSLLDGFCSMALASALGWGVFASVATILLFQGGLATLAAWFAQPLDELSISVMTIVGGIILLATSLLILDIKKIAVANMLPGVFLPPLLIWMTNVFSPGLLLPAT